MTNINYLEIQEVHLNFISIMILEIIFKTRKSQHSDHCICVCVRVWVCMYVCVCIVWVCGHVHSCVCSFMLGGGMRERPNHLGADNPGFYQKLRLRQLHMNLSCYLYVYICGIYVCVIYIYIY